jgi:regulator of protease activity HflC (stomatin/prohibitin superfamily)
MKGLMNSQKSASSEREIAALNGWAMLPVSILMLLGGVALLFYFIINGSEKMEHPHWWLLVIAILAELAGAITLSGFFTLQPNEARLLLLFGQYKGTVRESGFHWVNPFYSHLFKLKLSLRARTLTVEKLKVNDKRGNPIEIAAVVVWRIEDTAQAAFDVDDYSSYVHTQSETALRHLASAYSYDDGEENEITLRSNVDAVSQALREELQQRLSKAGVAVDEARLTNLSYAPEIAQAMLRRQQAEAVIAARQKIVHGAVSMVAMALKELAEKDVVHLDDERKAAMVSNLLVVLCGESEVHPVVNAGTLYS